MTAPITDEELAAIDARLAAAHPGPWGHGDMQGRIVPAEGHP